MYSVMIIDDEWMIREGLKAVINWDEYGFSVIDEADNGILAVQKILNLLPDVLLIDIRMPGANGLEVIKNITRQGYTGEVIILTGYDDFSYAKEAIDLHVHAYLLKPIDESEMIKILVEIKEKLDANHCYQKEQVEYEQLRLEKDIVNLISKAQWEEQELIGLKKHMFLCKDSSYLVALMEKKHIKDMDQLIKKCFSSNILFISMEDVYLFVLKDKTYQQAQLMFNELIKQYYHHKKHHTFLTVGRMVYGFHQLGESYADARRLFQRKFLYAKNNIVFWQDHIKYQDKTVKNIEVDYIFSLIEVGNFDALDVFLTQMADNLIASDLSNDTIKGLCGNCYITIKEKLSIHYSQSQNLFDDDMVAINRIYNAQRFDEIMSYLKTTFYKVSKDICNGSPENTMKRILGYIHTNYYKSLRLEGLARLFNYNSSYLGKLFKEQMGVNFNTYIDGIRIEHAKELIESNDYKIYEVADKVGYNNVDYFYMKFKKHTGVSPSKYKGKI